MFSYRANQASSARETKPINVCADFLMLHIEFEFRNRRIDLLWAQRSRRVNGEKLVIHRGKKTKPGRIVGQVAIL